MTPTPEQEAIVRAAKETEDNLLVSALAGAAKTSSLVLVAEALPDKQILCLAFNKKIATEMQERLPSNCKAMTLNSLGHRVWGEAIGRRLEIDSSKLGDLMKAVIDEQTRSDASELYANMGELIRIVDFGKACGYIPSGSYEQTAKRLMGDEEFFDHLEQRLSGLERDVIREVTLRSLKLAFQGKCDYSDQLLMPTVFHGAYPRYPLTLVDEAQDLSSLNHATLRKMVGTRRLIAVGDPCQAIYGFRGAHEESMEKLRYEFSMRELPLTTSFRCPRAVVEHVQWRAPAMRWPEWAKPGKIETLSSWKAADLSEDGVVICRNNAPLFGLAIRLLKNGRTAELDGKDIVKAITKVMRKFGGHDLRQAQVFDAISAWEEKEKAKTKPRAHKRVEDRAECMRVFARQGKTLGDALAYADHIMQIHSPLKLMTGHKSKGLEFPHVYFLDEHLVGKEDQDPNLRYVIQTRTKDILTYICSEDFHDNEPNSVPTSDNALA